MKLDKRNIIRLIFAIWIVLWINFILRDLFRKGYFYDYKTLIKRDEEGRRSYVYGDYFYSFLKFVKEKLPQGATYKFMDEKDYSLDYRRTVYHLYPLLQSDNPDYILAYNLPDYQKSGYELFAKLDNNRFILRKK